MFDITDGNETAIAVNNTSVFNADQLSSVGIADESLLVYLDASNISSYPGTGNTWYDLSGNNNNAILNGNASNPYWTGDSFYFPATANGLNGAMQIPSSTTLNDASEFTISMLFTLETKTVISGDSAWMCLFSKSVSSSGQSPAISIHQDSGSRYLHIERPSGFNSSSNIFTDYTGQTWYHVVAVISTTSYGYINGTQVSTALGGTTSTTNPIYIGTDYDSEMFKGKLRYLKVFNRALTAEEIAIEADIFNSDKKMKIHKDGTLYIAGEVIEGL
jgi:hypothetical protein